MTYKMGETYIPMYSIYTRSGVPVFKFPVNRKFYRLINTFRKGPLSKKGKLTFALSHKRHDFIPEQVTKMFVAEVQFCNWYFTAIYNVEVDTMLSYFIDDT